MAKKSSKTTSDSTTKHVVISAVAHETLTVLADRYSKSLGEMVTILINNCYDYGLIQADEIRGGKHTVTTRIDLLEKQLKRTNDGNWSAIAEMKKNCPKVVLTTSFEQFFFSQSISLSHKSVFILRVRILFLHFPVPF